MPSLVDAYGGSDETITRRRLYVGAVALFVGAVVFANGLARVTAGGLQGLGFSDATSLTVGIAFAAMAVPVVGAALHRWVPFDRRLRSAAAAGILLAALAVAAFVVTTPPSGPSGLAGLSPLVVAAYLVGTLVALWSPLVAAGLAERDRRPDRPVGSTSVVRETRQVRADRQVPADGGQEDEQLAFLLDQDR